MKFNINKELLVGCLQKVLSPSTGKQSTPALNSLLITTTEKKIKITSTDLDLTIISTCEGNILNPGETVVPTRRFSSIIRELPPKEIEVEKVKNNLLIRCEKIEFKMNTLDSGDFPKPQESKTASLIKIDPQVLKEMITLTSFCVGVEDISYVLNGILFEINENTIKLVATDGRRLAFIEKSLPANQPEVKQILSFILPAKAVNELHKLIKEKDEEIYLSVEDNRIGFDLKDTQFIARPTEGEFPNYKQYIPAESKDKLTINRRDLLFALRRASLLSTSDHQGVKMELRKNNVIFSKNTPQLGEAREEVQAQYSGAHLEIGFNPNYLIDVLKNLEDEEVSVFFLGSDKPAVLRKENYIYLVLPLKL